jgi:hypothetical protein
MSKFCSSVVLLLLTASLFGPSLEGAWDERGMGPAEVSAESQKAFAEASSSSSTVYILKKGDAVKVILRISAGGENWCRIVLPGQAGLSGYVPCKALASASSIAPVSNTGTVPAATSVAAAPAAPSTAAAANVRYLTNNDISEMTGAGLPAEILIAKIKSSACNFDTAPAALKGLKTAGVPDQVILSMVEAPVGLPARTAAATATPMSPEPSNSASSVSTPTRPGAATGSATPTAMSVANAPNEVSIPEKKGPGVACVILKRMGPADQITSHLYAFGLRGKQFQYVEGDLPNGVKFHGRLTDHDVRLVQDHGGKVQILEPKYSVADLEEARKGCQTP